MSLLDRELDHFLAICEAGNLARAADSLGLSQPALTRSLQRLEARLGARLFVRTPRGVEATGIGTALRARVGKARATLDDAEREVGQMAAGKSGKLRIGAGYLPARFVSRALFPRLIVERPAAQVQFHVAFNVELFERLEGGSLDVAVCGLLDPPSGLVFRELFASEMAVVVRKGHPLTRLARPTARDLAKFRGAAPSVGVRARQVMEDRMTGLGIAVQLHAIESNSWEALLDVVAATDLFTMAPMHEALLDTWVSKLVAIDIPHLDIVHRTGVVTRTDAYLSPLTERAIELIQLGVAQYERKARAQPHAHRTGARA